MEAALNIIVLSAIQLAYVRHWVGGYVDLLKKTIPQAVVQSSDWRYIQIRSFAIVENQNGKKQLEFNTLKLEEPSAARKWQHSWLRKWMERLPGFFCSWLQRSRLQRLRRLGSAREKSRRSRRLLRKSASILSYSEYP